MVEREQNPIARLAERHSAYIGEGASFKELADRFYKSVRAAGLYSWVCVIYGLDESGQNATHIFLSEGERDPNKETPEHQQSRVDVMDTFSDLVFAYRSIGNMHLHKVRQSEKPQKQLEKDIKQNCKETGKKILYSEQLVQAI